MLKRLLAATVVSVSTLVAGACDVSLAENVKAIEPKTWAKMITDMGQEKTATQKMAKAFLFIRKNPTDSLGHKQNLQNYIYEFDDKLSKILKGEDGYAKPPLEMICNGLENIQKYWPKYREIIYPAVDPDHVFDENEDDDLLGNLSYWNMWLYKKVDAVERMYVSVTQFYSPDTPGKTIELAERQSALSQKMTKDALFIAKDYDKQKHLDSLQECLNVFDTTHQGLLKGLTEIGLPPLAKRCTMWEMRKVTDMWENFKPDVQYILDTEGATDETIKKIETKNLKVLKEMNKAVALFVEDDDTECAGIETRLSFDLWANGINEAGRGQMFSQKSTRLIYQVAQPNPANLKVDQDELVDTLAVGLWTLNTLIEGSVALTVPALPTQSLIDEFVAARETWKKFEATLTNNAQRLPISSEIIARVAFLRETYWGQMAETIDAYVDTAKTQAPDVHSEVIFIAGRQRSLQCKLASEALAVDLDCRPDHNRQLAAGSIKLYLEVHWKLLLGEKDAEGNVKIKRTTNICMLDQMLTVIDSYARIRGITGLLMESSKDTSSKADLQSFHEIINAGYGIMNAAVEMYIADGGVCTLLPDSEEWDEVIGEVNHLREMIERASKDFFFTMKDLNTTEGDIYLHGSMEELKESLHLLTYGNTAHNIPTPPSQPAANKLFAVTDAYKVLEALLQKAPDASQEEVDAVAKQSAELVEHVQELMDLYIDDAWEKDKTVLGARLNASGSLNMLIERAQKQVIMLQFPGCAECIKQGGQLGQTIEFFESKYQLLLNGNVEETKADAAERRLATAYNGTKLTVPPTEDVQLVNILADVRRAWDGMKPALERVVETYKEDGEAPSATEIVAAADSSKAVYKTSHQADALYTSASRTTTSIPLDVLTPVPLTGRWNAGRTMRTAARVAENMINYQQIVMPGFAIYNNFFDDKCDSQEGMRLVLQESASVTTDYVALGGMGCTEVCASANFAALSMNMPFLSYECSGRKLSSETDYEGFTRMGTPLTQSLEMLESLVEQYKWAHVAIVSSDPQAWRDQVQFYQTGLLAAGIQTSYYSSFDSTIDETIAMTANVVADKRRVVLLLGNEGFMRRVICGTRVAEANVGLAWVYEGVQSDKWWTVNDNALIASQPECTGVAITESFQGAINFAGLGQALPSEESLPLDCFEGHTSKTFMELTVQHLHDGYPVAGDNETQVQRPHMELIGHSADGVCALAKTMAHFLLDHTVDDLRNPSTEFYQDFITYLKQGLAFQGVSGWVNFTGNDKPESIAMKQVRGDAFVTIGMAYPNGTMDLGMNGGLANDSWTAAKEDVEESFPWLVFKIITPLLCVCCPAIAGCIRQG